MGEAEQEARENPSGQASEEAQLEFRPCVKYAGIGLAVLALLGLEYATYRVGHERGYAEATASGNVSEAVNTAAVENLTHFMQATSRDDASLLATVANREKELGWIRDPDVRREAGWTLAQALIDRGLALQATELLAELFRSAPEQPVWARRAMVTARGLAEEGRMQEALAYYRYASTHFAAAGQSEGQLRALTAMVELLASTEGDEEVLSALEGLQHEAAALGEAGQNLRAHILACMGRLYRVHGDHARALTCFEEALSGMNPDETPELASAAVCYGSALLEKGDRERAERFLRDGVSRLGDNPAEAPYLVSALRDLAFMEQEQGNTDAALALLYRAEGAAMGRIAPQSNFWLCLFDQRGWVHYTKEAYESALADFHRALALMGGNEELRVQPLEGAGRCGIALGKAEEAERCLRDCLELRKRWYASDTAALGRVNLLLGQAYDMAGKSAEAAEAYGQAAQLLPADSAADDRLLALMGRAYALAQRKEWEAASAAWEEILPLVKADAARTSEVRSQWQLCRRYGSADAQEEQEIGATPARPSRPASARRSRRR